MPTADGPRDEFVRAPAAPALARYVAGYAGYWQEGLAPALHRGLPSPYLTLIFTVEHPLTVARHPDPAQAPSTWRTLIGGLHSAPALIRHDGAQSGIQAMVTPLGARALLGRPAGELAGVDVDAADLLPGAESLSDRLADAASWRERLGLVDRFLLGRVRAARSTAGPAPLEAAWTLLQRSAGQLAIAEVAAQVGLAERALRRGFAAEFGLAPKQAARVARFDGVRRGLASGRRLADLAAGFGYSDQAHLTREFAGFAGLPPAAWLAEAQAHGEPLGTEPVG